MRKPLLHEIANIAVVSITVVIITVCAMVYINELKFCIPGFIAVLIGFGLIGIIWINRIFYDKKVRKVQLFLDEIIAIEKQN